jgi:sec-independent protein translocase protein TatC
MAATAVRPIGHEDRLSIIEHLDELRTRLIICVATVAVVFAVCAWQNGALLSFIGKPLASQTEQRTKDGKGPLGGIYTAEQGVRALYNNDIRSYEILERAVAKPDKPLVAALLASTRKELAKLPQAPPTNQPVTLGIGEPFSQTIAIATYFALLFSLPLLLFQLYAFILPAFSPSERRVALPLMTMIPFLFAGGVAFAYWVVLPPATKFLQNFNADKFQVLVQAKDYYKFAILTLISCGLVFQAPVGILAATRVGIVTLQQLRSWRRYAIVINAVVAMALPGTAPIPMLFEFAVLHALYEMSLIVARFMGAGQEPVTESSLDEDV